MNTAKYATRLAVATTAAGLVATGLLVGAGSGAATPVSLTLDYTCPFPLIGNQAIKVVISTDIPDTIGVGQPTGAFDITAITTVPDTATQGLTLVGAATVEGTAVSAATVTAPGVTLPVNVPIAVEKTPVPASGAFDVKATGQTPSLTFSQAGPATIAVNGLTLTLTPKKADGSATGLGTFDSPCTLNPGQNNTLHTFEITGAPTTTTTQPTTTTTTQPTTTTTQPTTTTTQPTTTTTTTSPPTGGVKIGYDLKGSSTLKALNGSVPLSGAFTAEADLAAGTYTGALTLNPTSGKFTVLGFLPAAANIAFAQVGPAGGTVKTGAITFAGALDITLTKIAILGLPVYQGTTCKTTTPSAITLGSSGPFDVLKGGTLVGTYDIGKVSGCGPLNGLIAPLVTSKGNTIKADLAVKK
ncbi:hypothetical protein JOD54_002456 [Actinokineospora baliensis]|uniref:DUF6801 domain-containing protein n=1 Tax=Actinokineospora baliensis TaxID=547056 RepID=UPI001958491C|nr:DUF6801 domain-containing protein [Actinokineospora baliensis]MBM7772252.1 hypothetical protein [Actinokineospora baliensis]